MKKKSKILEQFFIDNEFLFHPFQQDNKQCAEVEKWTDGGVDMIITLQPFTKEKFIEYVNDFDMDSEIDLHREGKLYRANFTISQSVKDFKRFKKHLKSIVEKLEEIEELK